MRRSAVHTTGMAAFERLARETAPAGWLHATCPFQSLLARRPVPKPRKSGRVFITNAARVHILFLGGTSFVGRTETARDVLAEYRTRPADQPLKAGLRPERERPLLSRANGA